MSWSIDLCDDAGLRRAFVTDHSGFKITPRINGYAEVSFEVDMLGTSAAELAVAERSIKVWQGGTLRFHGQVWEPLSYSGQTIRVVARDPLAVLENRRVQGGAGASTVYTAVDAGAIAHDRLSVQNLRRKTGLVAGALAASATRTRTYLPGKREDEILQELADAELGFFYKVTPTDTTPGVRGQLDILYPNAGTSREDVRFEYGTGTLANLDDFELLRRLPRNRSVASSSSATGGRIAAASEDAASIAQYGLFEDEETYSDVTDTTLLGQQARAGVRPSPPRTLSLQPSPDAPLLFTNFGVGDFVRVRIKHGPLDLFVWARVLEATLSVDTNGVERLDAIVVETVTGGRLSSSHNPAARFRRQLDGSRRRLEALERRVENITQTATATPADPAPGTPDADAPPADPTPPPPPPPPAPPADPSISGLTAVAGTDGTITAAVDVNGNGVPASVAFLAFGFGTFGTQSTGSGFAHASATASGVPTGTYDVYATVNSAGGTHTIGPVSVTVPVAHGGV